MNAHGSGIELDADIDAALDGLRRSFPGVCTWHGEFTGSLWALLPDRLVEAKNAAGLAHQIRAALGPPRPAEGTGRGPSVPPLSARGRDGAWTSPRHEAARPHRSPGRLARLMAAFRRPARDDYRGVSSAAGFGGGAPARERHA